MKRRTQAEWRALFDAQASSGLTAAAFCRSRGLCPKYFSLRRRQLLSEPGPRPKQKAESAFVPVAVWPGEDPATLEVRVGTDVQLRVPASVSPAWLAELRIPAKPGRCSGRWLPVCPR